MPSGQEDVSTAWSKPMKPTPEWCDTNKFWYLVLWQWESCWKLSNCMSELLCNCNKENKTENNKNQLFQSQVEEQLNLTTKFRLWIIRNWVNCSHKLNTNEIKSRKNPFELFNKGRRRNKTEHIITLSKFWPETELSEPEMLFKWNKN